MNRSYSFLFVFSLFVVLLFAVTCKKELSYEGGLMAAYHFEGSPQQCTDAVVNGSYYAGVTTDSANSVQLIADVTSTGTYNIMTNASDGMQFSGSGKFSDTGRQTVILYCKGTPTASGTFSILIPGTTGCNFSVTVAAQSGANFTLSGSPGDCSNPVHQGSFTQGVAVASSNIITINIDVIEKGAYSISTDTVNGFYFSGSGTFASTGTQQVILQANGTPNSSELSRFSVTAGASQCSFYVAVADPDPLATYVLQSGQQNGALYCAPGSIQGTYTANTTLTAGNTLTVNAYVTVPGHFTISTTEVNGLKFSFTGTFTNTGAQDVVLKGSGRPLSSGMFTFLPQIVGPAPLGGSSCGLDVIVQ